MTRTVSLIRTALLAALLSLLFLTGAAAADLGVGTVTAGPLRLRAEPTTNSAILATASKGTRVIVREKASNGWYKVVCGTVDGYMSGDYLTISTEVNANLGYALVDTGSSTLNLRSDAGTGYQKLASIPGSTVLPIEGMKNGWYKVTYSGKTGYISSDYVKLVKKPSAPPVEAAAAPSPATASPADLALGEQIVAYAKNFLGCKYVYGGNGPKTFDCSGFTKYVYKQFGYDLNRTATNQLKNGVSVSRSELQPGDLVFFKYQTSKPVSHVGIYIGDGQFIHASTTTYTVRTSDMSSGHYYNVFVYGRRIV